MSTGVRFVVAALAVTTAVAVAAAPDAPPPPTAGTGPATVRSAVAPAVPEPRARERSVLAVARGALGWQLAAEAGQSRPLPAHTFTGELSSALAARPPRPGARPRRARVLRVREQTRFGAIRRVLATVRRTRRVEHLTLLIICRPDCRVASIE